VRTWYRLVESIRSVDGWCLRVIGRPDLSQWVERARQGESADDERDRKRGVHEKPPSPCPSACAKSHRLDGLEWRKQRGHQLFFLKRAVHSALLA
jgi:hypothetical protein